MKKCFSRILSVMLSMALLLTGTPVTALAGSVPAQGTGFSVVCTVSFTDTEGGQSFAPIEVEYGESCSLPTPEAPEGLAFVGWSDGSNTYTGTYAPENDITLTAVYQEASVDPEPEPEPDPQPQEYTITFVNWDGAQLYQTTVPADTAVTAAQYYAETPAYSQAQASEFSFTGWNPASATVDKDTTFTATFKHIDRYTVTVHFVYENNDDNDVFEYNRATYVAGETADSVTIKAKEGFTPSYYYYNNQQHGLSGSTLVIEGEIHEDRDYYVVYVPNTNT